MASAAGTALYYARTTVAALAADSASTPAPPPPPGLATQAVVAAAAFFALDSALSRLPLGAWLDRWARTPPPGPKARAALAREVTIKLVGLVHLGVQLPLATVALAGAGGRAAFGGPPLRLLGWWGGGAGPGAAAALPPAVAAARLYAATPLTHAAVAISAGYFAWDVVALLPRLRTAGSAMLAHGLLCAALYWYGALSGSLSFYGAMFVLWEASTPAVYARWLALETGWGPGTRVYTGAGVAMMASFFVARVLGGAAASAAFWASAAAELGGTIPRRPGALPPAVIVAFRAANVGMTALNLWWFSRMVAGLARLVARLRAGGGGAGGGGVGGKRGGEGSPRRGCGRGLHEE